jgi:hypothetical protein
MTDFLTDASKIYVNALKRMGLFFSWSMPQHDENSLEEMLRKRVKEEAVGIRQTKNARIARAALKEVAYLKMSKDDSGN